jgi:hypothetical protein
MAIRMYLEIDPSDKEKFGGFNFFWEKTVTKNLADVNFNVEWCKVEGITASFIYKGITITREKSSGKWYVQYDNFNKEIHPDFLAVVDFVSIEEIINVNLQRELGIYRLRSAEIEFDYYNGLPDRFKFSGRAKSSNDLQELYLAIRAGTIRPEQSYEAPQAGLSGQEILAKLEKTEQELKQSEEKFQVLVNAFKGLISALKTGWWSFCTKKRIIKAIGDICSL